MIDKPAGCRTCVLWGDGLGFVQGAFPEGAELMIVGQAPGADEEEAGEAFVGATGKRLANEFLPLAGVDYKEVARDNAIRCRWREPGAKKNTNKLPGEAILNKAIACCRQYDVVPASVRLVIAMGTVALRKMGPGLRQHEWRGHLLPEVE